jgi:hypothetical protein
MKWKCRGPDKGIQGVPCFREKNIRVTFHLIITIFQQIAIRDPVQEDWSHGSEICHQYVSHLYVINQVTVYIVYCLLRCSFCECLLL